MPPFEKPKESVEDLVARNKKLSEERELAKIQERKEARKREMNTSTPSPRLIGKNAAAGRDDAPQVRYDPETKTHITIPEDGK